MQEDCIIANPTAEKQFFVLEHKKSSFVAVIVLPVRLQGISLNIPLEGTDSV